MLAVLRSEAVFVPNYSNPWGSLRGVQGAVAERTGRMQSDYKEDSEDEDMEDEDPLYNPYRQQGMSKSDTPVLDNFGIDITKAAEEGTLDPIVGREREIERLAQILSRRKKNNPVLIGEPGVGKSAIAEGWLFVSRNVRCPGCCLTSGLWLWILLLSWAWEQNTGDSLKSV